MKKRILRRFTDSGRKMNRNNGIFCAEQVQFVVCTAVHNIDSRRTLVLYVYPKDEVLSGNLTPRWTVFQTRDEYLSLCTDKKGTRWQTCMFDDLNKEYHLSSKCAFYASSDEQRVVRFCKMPEKKGFSCLYALQYRIFLKRHQERKEKSERQIQKRMKTVGSLPRDIRAFIHRETLPHYIFYDYRKGKAPMPGHCTACGHDVEIIGVKHNQKGICPYCKKPVTFKSQGRRGRIIDRSTTQVIQRTGEHEVVIRIVKAYATYPKGEEPALSVYENGRLFLTWKGNKLVKSEPFYYCYDLSRLTPWHKGSRPVFSRWQYNFEADECRYLYHRNLDNALKGTPWQYAALKEYYLGDPTPLCADMYLKQYLSHPMLEYLVKLRLYRLATYVVYGEDGRYYYGNQVLNSAGKNVAEVLGVGKRYLSFLQEINPGAKQLMLIKALLRENVQPDMELMKWCSEFGVGEEETVAVPLRFMTPHKLMRYATDQFAAHKKMAPFSGGYYSMSYLMSDYKDYLCMSEALDYDMKSDFVLFPKNLKEAHDRVNDLSDAELSAAYDRKIAKQFAQLQSRYQFEKNGLMIIPPGSAKEIVAEGQKLHHCVGRYVKDVVKSKCIILFIRQVKMPHKPYCTLELKNGAVVQARIEGNAAPPPKVQQFIETWKQKVLYASEDAA